MSTREGSGTHEGEGALQALHALLRWLADVGSIQDLLLGVGHRIRAAVQAQSAVLFLVDEGTSTLWSINPDSPDHYEFRLPLGAGMAGQVAQTGEALAISDCNQHPVWLAGTGPQVDRMSGRATRTMLVEPVKRAGRVIGVLQVVNKLRPDGSSPTPDDAEWPVFSEQDVQLVQSIAASLANTVPDLYKADQERNTFLSTVQTLSTTMDRRNPEAAGHSRRVSLIAEIVARQMGLPPAEVEKLRIAGLLHDVGKIGVPEAILTSQDRLTAEQHAAFKAHATLTREILEQLEFPVGSQDIPAIAAQHHERLSGRGYPEGLAGSQILPGARILAVADVYDALRVQFPYRNALDPHQSLAHLREEASRGELDPTVVEALAACQPEIESACADLRPS